MDSREVPSRAAPEPWDCRGQLGLPDRKELEEVWASEDSRERLVYREHEVNRASLDCKVTLANRDSRDQTVCYLLEFACRLCIAGLLLL